jgi:hypothetical protein
MIAPDTMIFKMDTNLKKRKSIKRKSYLNTVTYLDGEEKSSRHRVDAIGVSFKHAEMKVTVSLPKMRYGNNMEVLKYCDLKDIFGEIEDVLGVSILNARLSRIDMSCNLIMKHDCKYYFNELLSKGTYKKQDYKPGINFINSQFGILLYDKLKEAKKEGVKKIPDEFAERNLLRCEFRCKKDITRLFKRNGIAKEIVTVGHLLDKKVYNYLIHLWYYHYLSIDKGSELIPNPELLRMGDYRDAMAQAGIRSYGVEHVLNDIAIRRKEQAFGNATEGWRTKKMINEIIQNDDLCIVNPYIRELNRKMTDAVFMSYC